MHLRALTRAVDALNRMLTQEKARQHAAEESLALPRLVASELKRHQRYLEQRRRRAEAGWVGAEPARESRRVMRRARPPVSA